MLKNNEKQKKDGLFFDGRHLSWLFSGLIVMSFFVFIAGFFLGQKKAVSTFAQKMEQESLADQIYSSLCSLYDNDELVTNEISNGDSSVEQEDIKKEINAQIAYSEVEPQTDLKKDAVIAEDNDDDSDSAPGTTYYAQLIGFGTQKAAQQFVNKLAAKGIQAKVHKRQSKTARGKTQTWYQVVTELYEDKKELEIVVNCIRKDEKIHDVRIITC